eukprot:gnl/TRDRNA2_/TRDRNA2_203383_c0_seq1.p1 gnl/TRDRNA2_/TRDRNA2_203383_c0~~gnl/TRDRNA2_/TRDRNA2_203383_c0_seq1.p1  ORF type:complete len:179 (+),score=31.02 gnl/TRDRNA2_/TRDRNA2_203383_c0_seq1:22-537(+)
MVMIVVTLLAAASRVEGALVHRALGWHRHRRASLDHTILAKRSSTFRGNCHGCYGCDGSIGARASVEVLETAGWPRHRRLISDHAKQIKLEKKMRREAKLAARRASNKTVKNRHIQSVSMKRKSWMDLANMTREEEHDFMQQDLTVRAAKRRKVEDGRSVPVSCCDMCQDD